MNILQVAAFLSPAYGGGAIDVCYHLSKELAQRGHEVTIYASDYKLNWEHMKAVPQVKTRTFRTWGSLARFYVTPAMPKEVGQEVCQFDVIHMHAYRSFQNTVIHYYAKKLGIPYILQAHGSLETVSGNTKLKWVFDKTMGHKIVKDAAKVIAETPTEAEQYKSMGISEDKIEIVPNGVDLSEFENLPQRGQFRKKYGLDDAQKVVLYLARIHKIKGPDLLAKAFAELSKDLGDAKLVIAGPDDGYLATLKELIRELKIEERVLITGLLNKNEKLQAYVDADVYVLPSVYETFPISVLEACACGIPVIVTDRCGIANIVDGQLGFVVPYDKDELANKILHMLADNKLRREFGEKGKLLVREKFNWDKIAQQVENIYSSCMLSNHRAQG
jgi:glycosyltransferase involved in cell wall biosynthesis